MYPQFELFWVTIYSFWIALSLAFVLFFWMLYRLSLKFWINTNFFLNNIFFYFISIFLFSRLFYILAEWREYKHIFNEWVLKFFFMSDYNFSLIWGIVWFMMVMYFKIKKYKLKSEKYIDAAVLAFLFAAVVWYIWTFLWGQILWKSTTLSIGVIYTSPFNKSSLAWPIFPLAVIYSIICAVLFVWLYITRIFIKIEWFVGFLWIILFCSLLIIFEFYNWVIDDSFSSYVHLSMTQLWALWLIIYAGRWISKIYKQESGT